MLLDKLLTDFSNGIQRNAIDSASKWACNYRVMSTPVEGPWGFRYHPWLKEMHNSTASYNTGQKSAQAGFTETVLNIAFYQMDVLRRDVLYLLPSAKPDAHDFSNARVNGAIKLSPYLDSLFSSSSNVGHKRAGALNFYIRGANSESGLKSIPVAFLAIDEFDAMNQRNVALAEQRMAGQFEKMTWNISTATIPNFGISKRYNESTKEIFLFRCPHCSKELNLEYPRNFVHDSENWQNSHVVCHHCTRPLDHQKKHVYLQEGFWQSTQEKNKVDPDHRGFHVNQLYSSTVKPAEISRIISLAEEDQSYEQELYNSVLGLPYIVKGAQLSLEEIDERRQDYVIQTHVPHHDKLRTMGVDQGTHQHCTIYEWDVPEDIFAGDINARSRAKLIACPEVTHFEELDQLMRDFQIDYCVVDIAPERREATKFARRFHGYVNLCFYSTGSRGKNLKMNANDGNEIVGDYQMNVDRTYWLDTVMSRYRNGRVALPKNIPDQYRKHLNNIVKVYDRDNNGNPRSRYVCPDDKVGDHYMHSAVYAEIALPLALMSCSSSNNYDLTDIL